MSAGEVVGAVIFGALILVTATIAVFGKAAPNVGRRIPKNAPPNPFNGALTPISEGGKKGGKKFTRRK